MGFFVIKLNKIIFCKFGYIVATVPFQEFFKNNEELFMLILMYFTKSSNKWRHGNFYKCKMYTKGKN